MEVRGWVAPHGKGKITLVFFRSDIENRERGGYIQSVRMNFPNAKDGLYICKSSDVPMQSTYKWPYMASHHFDSYKNRNEWKRSKLPEDAVRKSWDLSEGYIFRVNTIAKNNKVISANYGKISPGVKLVGSGCKFVYFYNPVPNDRNLEFDPKKNLAKDGPRVWMEQFGL